MKNFIILLLGVGVLIGGGWGALTMRERDDAVRERDEARKEVAEFKDKTAKLELTAQVAKKERETAQADLKKAQENLAVANTKVAAAEAASAKASASRAGAGRGGIPSGAGSGGLGGPSSTKPMKALADMMKNPAMREMIKQQQVAQLDMQYGGLMAKFQLDDTEKANFKQLLADRLTGEGEAGLKMMDDTLTPEQRKALVQEMTASKKATEEKIKTFLNNDEDYKTYQDWEETKPERIQLSMGQSAFTAVGEPLSPQQEEQLVNTMSAARRQPGKVPDMTKPENFDPSNLSQQMIEQQLAKSKGDADNVYRQAAAYLTAKQLQALKTMQEQWLEMQKMGMNMSKEMMKR